MLIKQLKALNSVLRLLYNAGYIANYLLRIIVTGFWKNDPNRTLEVPR